MGSICILTHLYVSIYIYMLYMYFVYGIKTVVVISYNNSVIAALSGLL